MNKLPQKVYFICAVLFLLTILYFDYHEQELISPQYLSATKGGEFRWPAIKDQLVNEEFELLHDLNLTYDAHDGSHLVLEMPDEFRYIKNVLLEGEETMKKILIWTDAYGSGVLGFGAGHEPFKMANCKVSACLVTQDRNLVPVKEYDAIIFHFRNMSPKDMPKERSSHQRWIFYEKESSSYIFQNPKVYNSMFNWTMTYRSDSDIWASYGFVLPESSTSVKENVIENRNYAENKTKMAAWFVSNCYSHSLRRKFVKAMEKFIEVDIYGKCGRLECPRDDMETCYQMAEKKYKFYLSFENSLCEDYVTEKFFNVLRYNIIPIVYGFGNYSHIAPPHSYIDALHFPTVKDLTDYLNYLDKNDTAYNEYFKWKGKYRVNTGWSSIASNFCNLCAKLHNDKEVKTYNHLADWFVFSKPCKTLKTSSWLDWFWKKKL